jgi:GxxExxY protein
MEAGWDPLSKQVIGCAIEVHRALGPGLFEAAYEECLCHELGLAGLTFLRQLPLPLEYKNVRLECGYRLDILVERRLIVEVKAVEKMTPVHEAQILTYLKLAGLKTGLLLNFNSVRLRDGIKRFAR